MLGRAVHAGRGHVVLVAGFELDCHRLDVVAFAIFGVRFFVEATVAGCADVVGEVGALRHRDVGFGYDVGGCGVERIALWACVVRGGFSTLVCRFAMVTAMRHLTISPGALIIGADAYRAIIRSRTRTNK